jgi:hypothetical protein
VLEIALEAMLPFVWIMAALLASGLVVMLCQASSNFNWKCLKGKSPSSSSSPVVNETTILVVFVLMLLTGWNANIGNINSAFLSGEFEDRHKMYVEVTQGFEKYYAKGIVLLLLHTLYGTKQAALQFWHALIAASNCCNETNEVWAKQSWSLFVLQREKVEYLDFVGWWPFECWWDPCSPEGKERDHKRIWLQRWHQTAGGCKIVVDQVAKTMWLTQPALLVKPASGKAQANPNAMVNSQDKHTSARAIINTNVKSDNLPTVTMTTRLAVG